jgi:hypothetical protein
MTAREIHVQERENHARAREIHAQARADHVAARGGWNGAVKASTGSWDDGEDPDGARRSCGGTKDDRHSLYFSFPEDFHQKTGTPLNNQTKNIGLQNANSLFSFPLLQQRNQNIKPQHPA